MRWWWSWRFWSVTGDDHDEDCDGVGGGGIRILVAEIMVVGLGWWWRCLWWSLPSPSLPSPSVYHPRHHHGRLLLSEAVNVARSNFVHRFPLPGWNPPHDVPCTDLRPPTDWRPRGGGVPQENQADRGGPSHHPAGSVKRREEKTQQHRIRKAPSSSSFKSCFIPYWTFSLD